MKETSVLEIEKQEKIEINNSVPVLQPKMTRRALVKMAVVVL